MTTVLEKKKKKTREAKKKNAVAAKCRSASQMISTRITPEMEEEKHKKSNYQRTPS
jgi:hypothetical protein